METTRLKMIPAAVGAVILAGCVTGPDYHAPDTALPGAWPEEDILAAAEHEAWSDWWTRFEDPSLNELVHRALDDNLEIHLQTARIAEFRARLGLAGAERWPSVDAQAAASREQTPGAALGVSGVETGPTNLFSLSGLLSYELDLWGRLAREQEAAEALLQESVFAREAVRLNVVADVVTTYFDLRAAENQVSIARETLASREETVRLQEIRHEAGEIDDLALQQARSERESTRAELPGLRQRKQVLEGALALLVGLEPAELWEDLPWDDGYLADIHLPDQIPAFLPAELLQRRPDLRAAEANLMAATAGIGVARADRLPRVNLSAMLGTAAASTGDLFTDPAETWSIGASATAPIWDFGRGRARVESAEARAEQAEVQYRMTVNSAFNDVRSALIIYEASTDRVVANRSRVASLQRTEELAEIRYEEGFTSFMEYLDAQRALLSARLALEEAARDQLTATATLFKSLGGGWDEAGRHVSGDFLYREH